MGYTKVITYGNIAEVYVYEKYPTSVGRKRKGGVSDVLDTASDVSCVADDREKPQASLKQPRPRQKGHARSAVMAFRRLVGANLGASTRPVFASFTYRENMEDIGRARKDWNAFAKSAKARYGDSFSYICVPEFQRRGAVHFHALIWGISEAEVIAERSTRVVAALWGQGYIDLVMTDGSQKLATYLSKYMAKNFMDSRLFGRKLYIASRNIQRPIIDKMAVLGQYFHGGLEGVPDLSTGEVLRESEYQTQWLGRANYKRYLINPIHA